MGRQAGDVAVRGTLCAKGCKPSVSSFSVELRRMVLTEVLKVVFLFCFVFNITGILKKEEIQGPALSEGFLHLLMVDSSLFATCVWGACQPM